MSKFDFLLDNKEESPTTPQPTPTTPGSALPDGLDPLAPTTPPPAPPRPATDPMGYDNNHWSRVLEVARQLRPGGLPYLEVLHGTGARIAQGKDGRLRFTPGPGWGAKDVRQVLVALYMYMAWWPAQQDGSPAAGALLAAVRSGGRLVPQDGRLRFVWREEWRCGAETEAQAKEGLNRCRDEVMRYINGAGTLMEDMGFVLELGGMASMVEAEGGV